MLIVIPLAVTTAVGYAAYIRYMLAVRRTCQCIYCAERNGQ